MLVEGLQAYIAGATTVTAVIGTPTSRTDSQSGVFPTLATESAPLPYIVFSQVAGAPTTTSMAGTNALQTERWRFSCYGSKYKTAKQLAKILKQALIDMDGLLPVGGAEIHGSWHVLEADDAESAGHGTIYATHLDFEITYLDGDTTGRQA